MFDHAANDATTPAALRDALRPLLALRAAPFGGYSLEGLDGFLTALAVGPELVMPSEWVLEIWGKAEPRWESEDEAVRVYGMVMALWNDVLRRIALDPSEHVDADDRPIFDDTDAPRGQAWAEGFLDGIDYAPDAWFDWESDHAWIEEALLDIEALTWPVVPDGLVADDGMPTIEHSDREEILANLPGMLHALHRHRLVEEAARTPIRREAPKVGRNDPCPCGSGRKYKKCCGA
ncbi:MAG: UPF0149 family protein [Proteobacteria bacterium]|nr:UPF0149 family protein [Pseudomonadota bacterium]